MEYINQVVLMCRLKSISDNAFNVYVTDRNNSDSIFMIEASKTLITKLKEFCNPGDLVGLKGFISNNKDGSINITAEKISFLSTKKAQE